MDHRKALTISLAVDKDDSRIGNPLKIAKKLLSSKSGSGKVQTQIHWTQITGPKVRYHDTTHKNGCRLLSPNHASSSQLELGSKKPCLILKDVLKTDLGKAYINRKSGGLLTSPHPNECWKRRESLSYGAVGIGLVHSNRSETPTSHQKTSLAVSRGQEGTAQRGVKRRASHTQSASKQIHRTPSTPQRDKRSFPRRKLEEKDEEEVQAVIIGEEKNGGENFTQVMDCGVSLSWRAAEDRSADEVTPQRWTDSIKATQHHQSKNRGVPELRCNGTSSAKSSRGSVLRLSGETRYGEGPTPKRRCLEGHGVVVPSDCGNFLFPKAGEDKREKALGFQSSSLDKMALASSSEFIVVSSDEEEESLAPGASQARTAVLHPQAGTGEAELQKYSPEDDDSQEGDMYSQAHGVAAGDLETLPDLRTEDDVGGVMTLPFSALRCGSHRAQAGGPIVISDKRIGIPLKEPGGQRRATLTLQSSGLLRYCNWDQEEHVAHGLAWEDGGRPLPAAFLLLYVSDNQALAVHRELTQLLGDQERTAATGPLSPFLLLSLSARMEGVEGALFCSNLDFICLNNSSHHDLQAVMGDLIVDMYVDLQSPLLPVDDCLILIHSSGQDPQLLTAFGVDMSEPGDDSDWDEAKAEPELESEPEPVQGTKSLTQLEAESQGEAKSRADLPTELPPQAEEAVGEAEVEPTSEKSPEKVPPVYTLCHRRTQGSNTVSLSRPNSTWTKYKHQGPSCRLIQFPPSPLKGGIPVTMEDLECLDSGHFLNDVIIDFYLKYLLLKKAPAGVATRSHIFSSFFYKQLTRRDNASEENTSASTQRQRRHQRVKNWTRHVDIFNKDFLFVPVNQESHWYLVVICCPGLAHALSEPWGSSDSNTAECESCLPQAEDDAQGSKTADGESELRSSQNEAQDRLTGAENVQVESPPGPPDCTEQTCQRASVCKRPCILIMDSLKVSLHERVFKLLREYLQSEWEVRRGSERDFSGEHMKSSHCRVPLQDNSSDCGLYLLQYVESFLKDPVVHFDLPLRLERWFPRQLVRRKRDEIRDLVLYLHRVQNPASVGC